MIYQQNLKQVTMYPAQAAASSAVTAVLDTIGFDYATISILLGTNAVSNLPTVCKLGEGDTSSAFTDIAGTVGGTDFTIPAQKAGTSSIVGPAVVFGVDMKSRKRWLQCSFTPITVATITVIHALLGRAEQMPNTAAKIGADVVVNV